MAFNFLLVNQVYSVYERVKNKIIAKVINIIWDIPFFKTNYLFAISKIFILHC